MIAHGIGRFALIVASCYVVEMELLKLFKLPAPFDHACAPDTNRPRRRKPHQFQLLYIRLLLTCLFDCSLYSILYIWTWCVKPSRYAKCSSLPRSHDNPQNAFAMPRPVIRKPHFINLAPGAAMRDVLGEADLELEVDSEGRVADTYLLSIRQEFVQLTLQVGASLLLETRRCRVVE